MSNVKYLMSTKVEGYQYIYLVSYLQNGREVMGYQFSDECQTFLSSDFYGTPEEAQKALELYVEHCL